ncbi:unnamed protein product [Symbiodinium sp. CCMP2592]|nr:unnamed protein product [Symbiodinium sp. CCMP2592]
MPPTQQPATASTGPTTAEGSTGFQLPWAAIPKFIPGTTDVTEYSRKLEFLAAMWPKEHLSLLAPRAALQVEGTAFKKIASLPPDKLKSSDESGIKLLVSTLGGSWGKTDLEAKYDVFEKALYGTVQKQDETNDSYLARHDVHFEELLSQSVTFEQVRAYILLRQSQLTSEDRKKIILELGGSLDYKKVCSSIRLLGSRFFADLQGQRVAKSRTYDANVVEEPPEEGEKMVPAMTASAAVEEADVDLDEGFMEAMLASEDQDALQVQAFEEELESFFQDTPELQEALVSYMEARNRLLAKKKSRGFWPIGGSKGAPKGGRSFKGGGKGKGKHREQLLARIARSNCRICGEKGHWKAECPRRKGNPSSEATTTVAEAFMDVSQVADQAVTQEILTSLPADALTLEEALCTYNPVATLAQQASHVEAILDTGASRCVMGKSLLQKFIGQLSDSVRSKIRAPTSRAPTASLGTRLVKLRDPTMSLSMAEIEALSLEKHGAFLVNFGTKMKGRTFMDCVEEGSDWTKWFVDHYHDSGKREHKVFINFVEKYVSQAEQLEVELRGEPAVIKSDKPRKTSMLSQAAPKARAREDGPEIPWEMLEEPALQDQVATLNSRMSQMEQVMQEMISAIRQLNALMQSQPTLSELRMFLRKVPWHLFAESTARAAVIAPNPVCRAMPMLNLIEMCTTLNNSRSPVRSFCRVGNVRPSPDEISWFSIAYEAPSPVFAMTNLVESPQTRGCVDVYQDSMLTYSTQCLSASWPGQRFTTEGDLETAEGQRKLWNLLQRTQPRHIWMSPDSRYWCYAPEQIVLGKSVRIPGSITSDEVGGTVRPRSSAKKESATSFPEGVAEPFDVRVKFRSPELAVLSPVPVSGASAAQGTGEGDNDIAQPEQELTPQVSIQTEAPVSLDAPEVERDAAAPSDSVQPTVEYSDPGQLDAASIPVPDSEEGLCTETVLLASHQLGVQDSQGEEIMDFTTLQTSDDFQGPKALGIRSSAREVKLFEQAKAKELQCWAVDLLGWLRALWGVVHVPHFDWRQPEKSYKLLNTALVVTNCKSLFDLVTRLAMPTCEEHRTTLEVLLIKQRCAENAQFRWIPTTLQVADSLTKNMDPSLLRTVLAQGRFRLFDTSESLARDAQRRKAIEWLQQPSSRP